ncbi:MAG: hypothetical protein M0R68_14615 [Bacteroidetes bacterium]|nr:hypothetical protein [Bacteroidota bacterium]
MPNSRLTYTFLNWLAGVSATLHGTILTGPAAMWPLRERDTSGAGRHSPA